MFKFDSFRTVRWVRTLNLVLQAVLFFTFFCGLNYLARNHAQSLRIDLTHSRNYSLSPETLAWIQSLPAPVNVVFTFTDDSDDEKIRGLLKEYAIASESNPNGKISISYLDPFQNRREADRLGVAQSNLLVFQCGDRNRIVPADQLYQTKNSKRSAFIGEQAVTNALLDVSNPFRQKIYFLTGHGELQPDATDAMGLSTLSTQLRVRNFDVEVIDLSTERKIPLDKDPAAPLPLIVAVAPKGGYRPEEQELLRRYLTTNAGRFILLLAPRTSVFRLGLEDLLLDWGVLADDDIIYDTDRNSVAEGGDLMIRVFDKAHPITQTSINNNMPLRVAESRSVRPDPGRSLASGLTVTPLAMTSPTAWGEVSYNARGLPHFDPGVDIRSVPGMEPKDCLSIALASERVAVRDKLAFSVQGGKLVVIGSGDFVANGRTDFGNMLFFLNAVNWTVDRDRQLNVPPRPIDQFQLSLSASDMARLRYALVFGLPGVVGLLGLAVYWTRRS